MACSEIKFHELYTQRGIESIRPKVGAGKGGFGGYAYWHRKNGYVGHIAICRGALAASFRELLTSDLMMNCNVLEISEHFHRQFRDEETRECHVFFKSVTDMFILKSLLSQLPIQYIVDSDGKLRKPIIRLY